MSRSIEPRVIEAPPGEPGELVVLSRWPRLYLIDDFADEREIAHILLVASDEHGLAGQGVTVHQSVAGRSFEMPVNGDFILEGLAGRIYERVGMDNDLGETMRFRHYQAGEYHPLHSDAYSAGESVLLLTAMLYLSGTEQGGETHFPHAKPGPILVRPRPGRLAIWFNYRPDGTLDETARHEALAVRAGEKITLTSFIYKPLSFCRTRIGRARSRQRHQKDRLQVRA